MHIEAALRIVDADADAAVGRRGRIDDYPVRVLRRGPGRAQIEAVRVGAQLDAGAVAAHFDALGARVVLEPDRVAAHVQRGGRRDGVHSDASAADDDELRRHLPRSSGEFGADDEAVVGLRVAADHRAQLALPRQAAPVARARDVQRVAFVEPVDVAQQQPAAGELGVALDAQPAFDPDQVLQQGRERLPRREQLREAVRRGRVVAARTQDDRAVGGFDVLDDAPAVATEGTDRFVRVCRGDEIAVDEVTEHAVAGDPAHEADRHQPAGRLVADREGLVRHRGVVQRRSGSVESLQRVERIDAVGADHDRVALLVLAASSPTTNSNPSSTRE